MSTDTVRLRECEPADLPALEEWAPTGRNQTHAMRLGHQQAGTSSYLLAHRIGDRDAFVGSCEIRWDGPEEQEVPRIPEINGLQVWPEHLRSRGIGAQILRQAEELARTRGHAVIGLGVEDPRALALYLRVGYVDAGLDYVGRYTVVEDDGREREVTDHCRWMTKDLRTR